MKFQFPRQLEGANMISRARAAPPVWVGSTSARAGSVDRALGRARCCPGAWPAWGELQAGTTSNAWRQLAPELVIFGSGSRHALSRHRRCCSARCSKRGGSALSAWTPRPRAAPTTCWSASAAPSWRRCWWAIEGALSPSPELRFRPPSRAAACATYNLQLSPFRPTPHGPSGAKPAGPRVSSREPPP